MMTGFLTKFGDAPIEKRLLRDMPFVAVLVRLAGTARGATNGSGGIKSERIAICDSACVFATDTRGIEAIAEGGS
jgi:hypothetical protein